MGRKLRQNCTACGLVFKAEEKYLGKIVKCPQCKEPVNIVDAEPSSSSSIASAKAPPPKSASSSSLAAPAAPAAKLPPAKAAPAPRVAPAAAAPARPAMPAVAESGIHLGTGDANAGATSALRSRRRSSNNNTLIMVGMGGFGVVTIVVLLGVVAFVSGAFDATPVADNNDSSSNPAATAATNSNNVNNNTSSSNLPRPVTNNDGDSSGFGAPGAKWTVFVLDLNNRERDEVQVRIDGEMKEVPDLGPIMYSLPPGQHSLSLTRNGYDPIDHQFQLTENGRETYRPNWQRAGSGGLASNFPKLGENAPASDLSDWLQDFEAAKRKAQAENKDILIAFNGSDWCVWCVRLMNEVLFQKEFREQIEENYVLVSIDMPRGREALDKVNSRTRNQRMTELFDISGYPTVILTDGKGQAYASTGYVEGGVDPFMREIAGLQEERSKRDELFAAVDSATGAQRLTAAEKAFEWLKDNSFVQHYGETLEKWMLAAKKDDPQNEQGQYEVFFEMDLMARFANADRENIAALNKVFDRLEAFNQDCEFHDGDRGGRLNLIATFYMAMLEENEAAAKFAAAGLAAGPTDPDIRSKLRRASQQLANTDVVGWGTGWVIAAGYILTNHHVIEDGNPHIRLPGREEPVPAKVLAKDKKLDIALLQVDDPTVKKLAPLPISTDRTGRGAPVGVFGYPLGDSAGKGLKLTTGIISALPDDVNEGMYLLDCTVNPGNSGGPLCNSYGQVIGLVTAKSRTDYNVDSYGMARPAPDLLGFLKKHLPSYQPVAGSDDELRWDQVDARVSESVLMIVMKE